MVPFLKRENTGGRPGLGGSNDNDPGFGGVSPRHSWVTQAEGREISGSGVQEISDGWVPPHTT